MFKNYARVENEICLCQFGLYTGKSHILRTPSCQQQVHAAQCRATWRTALQRVMLRQWNSRKPWLNPEDPRLGWAPEWNPEHKGICKKQEIIIPTKTSFGNYLPPLKFSCLYLTFFLAGAVLMVSLTPRADTFPSTENTKEAEILSITWR